jgi:glyoxalase family protein
VSFSSVLGIHHVTAFCGDPQRNVDFYAGVLGLRLVKVTVNHDDPGTYHLYFGDGSGSPGSVITFFPWPDAYKGRVGTGQAGVTAFSAPRGALEFWEDRLRSSGATVSPIEERFGERLLSFSDPDGLLLEIVEADDPRSPWEGPIASDYALRGIHSAALWIEGYERTAQILAILGMTASVSDRDRFRYSAGDGSPGAIVDLVCMPGKAFGRDGVGAVHHIAFRAADAAAQNAMRSTIAREGSNVSPVRDRVYFQSIYFREPSGVLFEIATDGPGFAVDEPLERLGESLVLPEWLESRRDQIRAALPAFRTPKSVNLP